MAHHDAFYEGALDNASGMAVMLGLAEYFSKIPQSSGAARSSSSRPQGIMRARPGTEWMHDNQDTFLAKTALMINCEHVSAIADALGSLRRPIFGNSDNIAARRWWVNGSSALASTSSSVRTRCSA